ncbi:MAG: N-acetylneuraminate synthase family protein [Planctomycetota bacterium]
MRTENIGGVAVSRERPFLILEAGVNHECSLSTAMEMVDAAADAGADMIKFQSYKAETLASRVSPAYWDRRQESAASQFELFQRHDRFGDVEYRLLAERCAARGILFCSTPFDLHFVEMLAPLVPIYKVASADITNYALLRAVAATGLPVLLSTGASYLGEVEAAVRLLETAGTPSVALLHCVLEYPTPPAHANLRSIPYLKNVFPSHTIGYSDHVPPVHDCLALFLAWVAGADILEKHFTLDKSLPGNDHYHAMDPDDVRAFVARVSCARSMLGSRTKTVLDCELSARKFARRSLVAAHDLKAGTIIDANALIAKRPGTGIGPEFEELVVGRRVVCDVAADAAIEWEMLGSVVGTKAPPVELARTRD